MGTRTNWGKHVVSENWHRHGSCHRGGSVSWRNRRVDVGDNLLREYSRYFFDSMMRLVNQLVECFNDDLPKKAPPDFNQFPRLTHPYSPSSCWTDRNSRVIARAQTRQRGVKDVFIYVHVGLSQSCEVGGSIVEVSGWFYHLKNKTIIPAE